MTHEDHLLAQLSARLPPTPGTPTGSPVTMLEGVVIGVHLGGLDVILRGYVNEVERVRYLASYIPSFGDKVWVARFGNDMIVLGDLAEKPGIGGIPSLEPWHIVGAAGEPSFLNSWVWYGSPYAEPGFAMQSDGWVRLKGRIKSGTDVMFTLPEEYRPIMEMRFSVLSSTSNLSGQLEVQPDGDVRMMEGNNTSFSLDGVVFPNRDAWNRTRDSQWFPFLRSKNGWDTQAALYAYTQVFRRQDGWRYIKGNIRTGTATAATYVPVTDLMPEDAIKESQMFVAREATVGEARIDIRALSGDIGRTKGGATQDIRLGGLNWFADRGDNVFALNPDYPNESMHVWTTLAPTNGWVQHNTVSSEWRPLQYLLDDFGIVHLRGLINGGAKTSNIFGNMPAGLRPLEKLLFPTVKYDSSGGVMGRVDINPNGDLDAVDAVANWHSVSAAYKTEA